MRRKIFIGMYRMTMCLLALSAIPQAIAGTRVALIVGVSKYLNIPSLDNPARDAALIATALRKVDFEVTELNQPEQITRAAIVTALNRFRDKANAAEAAIVYFAGHGVGVEGTNWLLPADVEAESPDDLEGTAISDTFLTNSVRGASAVRLVILDACRDNPFAKVHGWSTGTRSVGSRGLERMRNIAPNVVLLFATQAGATAADGNGAPNSPFARALASTVTISGVQLASLPSLVSKQMLTMTGVQQRPDQQGIFDDPSWTFVSPSPLALTLDKKYEQDAAKGDTQAMLKLGALYAAGRVVAQDFGVARRWFEQAAAGNNHQAMFNLGTLYMTGQGVAQNYDTARRWYEKAAANGISEAMFNLGQAYALGLGVTQDYVQAHHWYQRAALKGDTEAMVGLGILYANGTGVTQDYAQSRRLYEQAAAKGNSSGMFNLGLAFAKGLGVPQDYAQAGQWYKKSAAKANISAMVNLALLYEDGRGVPQDYGQARYWYEQAAEQGNSTAMYNCGILHARGRGVPQDYSEARRWYERAAAKGLVDAMYNLGAMYRDGQGVAKDHSQARAWFIQAASRGDLDAKSQLEALSN